MEDSTLYQYPTLKGPISFRILLLTGGSTTPLFAELIETTISDNFPYEAISYVWGDPTKSQCLAIRGGMTLKITKSLYNALRSIRHSKVEDGTRALWADGVCTYSDRSRIKHLRNLRFGGLFSEGFNIAYQFAKCADSFL